MCTLFFTILSVCAFTAVYSLKPHNEYINTANPSNVIHYSTAKDGKVIDINLDAEPDYELLQQIKRTGVDSIYKLYTRSTQSKGEVLNYDDPDSIVNSAFDFTLPTVVIVHGWNGDENEYFNDFIKRAILSKRNSNVIMMDWSFLSMQDYTTATAGVPFVGQKLGRFLDFLSLVSAQDFSLMHLVGFGLGAHLVGNAGRELQGQVARITGLDPAGLIWYDNSEKLKATDAVYVEAIHTNDLGFGIAQNVAHADFYPNGGVIQPDCSTLLCYHLRAKELFAASVIYNRLVGHHCNSMWEVTTATCHGKLARMGNDQLNKSVVAGMYGLETTGQFPFN